MSYPSVPIKSLGDLDNSEMIESSKRFLKDISSRYEFQRYANVTQRFDQMPEDIANKIKRNLRSISISNAEVNQLSMPGIRFHGSQLFVRDFNNPNTRYNRLLLNWKMGMGKTKGMLLITTEYADFYKRQQLRVPSVFIIANQDNQRNIIRELIYEPYFGFATKAELHELYMLQKNKSPNFNSVNGSLKRRATDRSRGGFYHFYGYKEFALHLFCDYDVKDVLYASDIDERIARGDIKLNTTIMNQLVNGFMVVDEVQNIYNIKEKNTYGIAIQYVLNRMKHEGLRAVFMSATPMTGDVSEVVDLLNLLIPDVHLERSDLFQNLGGRTDFKEGALEKIGALSVGRVSYAYDVDVSDYPEQILAGTSIDGIPFLKFVQCPISPLHMRTFIRAAKDDASTADTSTADASTNGAPTVDDVATDDIIADDADDDTVLATIGGGDLKMPALGKDKIALNDMVFPNPAFSSRSETVTGESDESFGLYNSRDVMPSILKSSAKWRAETGIEIKKTLSGSLVMSGPFLKLEEGLNGLAGYSSKYAYLVRSIIQNIKDGPGKIMIYHHYVNMSGVLLLSELMEMNGIINQYSNPTDSTLCSNCGVTMGAHKTADHDFTPARYLAVHYKITDYERDYAISAFNMPSNTQGYEYRVFIGSSVIKEGISFKSVRNQYVMTLPVDIPTLLQVMGRVVRKGSHQLLPPEDHNVTIHIVVASLPNKNVFDETPEIRRYSEKMHKYHMIQRVEKEFRTWAIDSFTGKSITQDTIYELSYSSAISDTPETLNRATFEAYNYSTAEVRFITIMLKHLFANRYIWTYDDLVQMIKTQGVFKNIYVNTSIIDEANIALAIQNLVGRKYTYGKTGCEIEYFDPFYIMQCGDKPRSIFEARSSSISVNINKYVEHKMPIHIYNIQLDDLIRLYATGSKDINDILSDQLAPFQYMLMEMVIRNIYDETYIKINQDMTLRLCDMYTRMKIFVDISQIIKLPDISADVRIAVKKYKASNPGGYIANDYIKVYDPIEMQWLEYSKSIVGDCRRFDENDVIVGYMDKVDSGEIKFKIRPPTQNVASHKSIDLRGVRKWSACDTRPRGELEEIILKLKIMNTDKIQQCAVDDLCEAIKKKLLGNEKESRQRNGKRWFYLFNESPPSMTIN